MVLLGAIWLAFLLSLPGGGMADWGTSAAALAEGRLSTIFTHMFAHAGLLHIGFNSMVLAALAGPLTARMGPAPWGWVRFVLFYLGAGLAGALLFLALNPSGSIPMLGASGAISGLIGLASRLEPGSGRLVPLLSAEMGRRVWDFAKANLILILIITVPIMLLGGGGGIAWEAHLGGFLAGLLAGPRFLRGPER